jgi:hypothetical protein
MSWEENDYVLDRPQLELNEEQLRGLTRNQRRNLVSSFSTTTGRRNVPENVESNIMNMVLGVPLPRHYAPGEARPRTLTERLNNLNRRRMNIEEAERARNNAAQPNRNAVQAALVEQLRVDQEQFNAEMAQAAADTIEENARRDEREAERIAAERYAASASERPSNIRNRELRRQSANRLGARNSSRSKRGKKTTYGNRSNYKATGPTTNKRNKKQRRARTRRNRK